MKKFFLFLTMALLCISVADAKIKVHTIGDSTMADYAEDSGDKRGWCQYLQTFFDSEFVTINNCGKSGADTRQFYTTSNLWASVKSKMSSGDYLLIQFAHNDEGTETSGLDNEVYAEYCTVNGLPVPTDKRGTDPRTTYRDFLKKFIDEARELGVTPVLVAPICRKYFSDNTITRKGQHDLGDKFNDIVDGVLVEGKSVAADDHSMDYVEAMRIVAEEKNVTFVNLTTATRDLYVGYGDAYCTTNLFCSGDKTHLQAMGANVIGRLGAQLLKEAGVLAEYINIPTELTASPTTLSIGDTYAGVAQQKEILITGYGLTPETGNVTITGTDNVQVSTDKTTYATTVNASYTGGNIFQRLYVKAQYAAAGAQNDEITISDGTTNIKVAVTANVISLEGGTAISVTWPFEANKATIQESIIVGPVSAEMTLSNMMAADVKDDFTDGGEPISLVRLHNSDATNAKIAWPANEIDENASRYVDFAVTAPQSNDIRLTSISLKITSHSTATMNCHINIGMGDNMEGVQTLKELKNMTDLALSSEAFTPAITIPAGETFHLRILPWHESIDSKSGKYIALKDVVIAGMAVDTESALNNAEKKQIKVQKVIENGAVYIIRGGEKYSIYGQKVQ